MGFAKKGGGYEGRLVFLLLFRQTMECAISFYFKRYLLLGENRHIFERDFSVLFFESIIL